MSGGRGKGSGRSRLPTEPPWCTHGGEVLKAEDRGAWPARRRLYASLDPGCELEALLGAETTENLNKLTKE